MGKECLESCKYTNILTPERPSVWGKGGNVMFSKRCYLKFSLAGQFWLCKTGYCLMELATNTGVTVVVSICSGWVHLSLAA